LLYAALSKRRRNDRLRSVHGAKCEAEGAVGPDGSARPRSVRDGFGFRDRRVIVRGRLVVFPGACQTQNDAAA
jgi:hypothetical protein